VGEREGGWARGLLLALMQLRHEGGRRLSGVLVVVVAAMAVVVVVVVVVDEVDAKENEAGVDGKVEVEEEEGRGE